MTIHIPRDGLPDLRFDGKLIAEASSKAPQRDTRWTELELYRTTGGKYVCAEAGYTRWEGEHDRFRAEVCESQADVIAFFGHGWLAKELYAEAGIEDVEVVE